MLVICRTRRLSHQGPARSIASGALYGGSLAAVGGEHHRGVAVRGLEFRPAKRRARGHHHSRWPPSLMLYVSGWLMVKQGSARLAGLSRAQGRQRAGAGQPSGRLAAARLPGGISRRRRNRAVHQCSGLSRGRLEASGCFAGLAAGDKPGLVVLFYFNQSDRAKASAAAAVHHHPRHFVCDGRSNLSAKAVQEFQEQAMLPFTELKSGSMAPWPFGFESERGSAVGTSYW